MTVEQAQELKVRLLRQCRFEPTIAEIMEEWKAMRRTSQAPRQSYRQPPVVNAAVLAKVRQWQATHKPVRAPTDSAVGASLGKPAVPIQLLMAYAKSHIADITPTEIEDNLDEIEGAYRQMKGDRAKQSPYITGLIRHAGMILPCMRRAQWG